MSRQSNQSNTRNTNTSDMAHTPLKIAVIGAGMMGQHHLRVCAAVKEVELVAVVDVDLNKAEEMAALYGIVACSDVSELISKVEVEAAIIAVPSVLHLEIGKQCLSNNIHCLMEKPLAVTEAECVELIKLAEKNKLMLLVGHVERFNAAVQQLFKELMNKRQIQVIHAERLNFNQQRLIDVDVMLDLMTHDLDIILSLIDKPVMDCAVNTICVSNDERNANDERDEIKNENDEGRMDVEADFATALIAFEGGAIVNITASRITPKKVRKLEITTDVGLYTLDFLSQEIWLHRDNNQVEQIVVHKQDALTVEILNFVHSVRTGEALGVTGQDALKTLQCVWQLQARSRKTRKKIEQISA